MRPGHHAVLAFYVFTVISHNVLIKWFLSSEFTHKVVNLLITQSYPHAGFKVYDPGGPIQCGPDKMNGFNGPQLIKLTMMELITRSYSHAGFKVYDQQNATRSKGSNPRPETKTLNSKP